MKEEMRKPIKAIVCDFDGTFSTGTAFPVQPF